MRRGRPTKMSTDPTLSELGITRDQSSQWQRLAAIPAEDFERYIAEAKDTRTSVTTGHALRAAGFARNRVRPRCPFCDEELP